MIQFGMNPTDLGVLTEYKSLPAELFGWMCFVLALLLVLRSVAARDTSPIARVSVSVCVLGAILQCASVGISIREFALVTSHPTQVNQQIALLKAEFVLAALGWLVLAMGVLIFQRQWSNSRAMSDGAIRHAWRPTFLVLSVALLCSAAGSAFGLGSYIEWQGSSSQGVLLISYGPQVLTWIGVIAAALIVLTAARRGLLSQGLVIPASLAAVGGLVLTVSTASLLTAVELFYKFLEYGWITSFIRIEVVAACVGMLAFAVACVAVARRPDASFDPGGSGTRRESRQSAPPYWPLVSIPTAQVTA
jgi:hypothetical protein